MTLPNRQPVGLTGGYDDRRKVTFKDLRRVKDFMPFHKTGHKTGDTHKKNGTNGTGMERERGNGNGDGDVLMCTFAFLCIFQRK